MPFSLATERGSGALRRNPTFVYSIDFKSIDLRLHPELYRVGVGEQGVLLVEPYKCEALPVIASIALLVENPLLVISELQRPPCT